MKTKMEMAHDYLLKIIPESSLVGDLDIEFAVDTAWKYADTMQAELDERNKAEAAQKRKEIREMLNAPNTFVEREGQHFDDVEEWQPDWTQAPEWANWWAMDIDKMAYYFKSKPYLGSSVWLMKNVCDYDSSIAPSHNYQGDWKDSLRERPE